MKVETRALKHTIRGIVKKEYLDKNSKEMIINEVAKYAFLANIITLSTYIRYMNFARKKL